jgi:hypothetical protein
VAAADLVREKRIVLAAGKHPLPTIADHVAGEPVRGNWWSHPKGGAIFAALQTLDHDPFVRICRLVDGRVTFVHASLWPAVLRLARDPARVSAAVRALPAIAKRLLDAVDAAGASGLRSDAAPARLRDGRRHLERALLVQTDEVHTESGKHAAVLTAWAHVGTERERRAAASTSLEESLDALVGAMLAAAPGATEKELRRWLPIAPEEVTFAMRRIARRSRP